MHRILTPLLLLAVLIAAPSGYGALAGDIPTSWRYEFPKADFTILNVDPDEIMSGGPPRDGIPPIDSPEYEPAATYELPATEPVIGIELNGEMRAYPVRVLMWHEIANDELGGVPISVTFCPLCNAAIVFDRRFEGQVLDFGTTGKLRNSDLVMYDRQTESFWQQAIGTGIVGQMTGKELDVLPARLESWQNFLARANSHATVLVPNSGSFRSYGSNPYVGYDTASFPFLYRGEVADNVKPLERVVTTPAREYAYSLAYIRENGSVTASDGTVFTWTEGQNSALDSRRIQDGHDVGNITAIKNGEDAAYFVEFAFTFHAFTPGVEIIN